MKSVEQIQDELVKGVLKAVAKAFGWPMDMELDGQDLMDLADIFSQIASDLIRLAKDKGMETN